MAPDELLPTSKVADGEVVPMPTNLLVENAERAPEPAVKFWLTDRFPANVEVAVVEVAFNQPNVGVVVPKKVCAVPAEVMVIQSLEENV